jgi:hypothetical protein
MNEPILTKKQVAERLGISPRTVNNLNLPHATVGGQNRYYWSEVSAAVGFGRMTEKEQTLASEIQALAETVKDMEKELVRLAQLIERRESG